MIYRNRLEKFYFKKIVDTFRKAFKPLFLKRAERYLKEEGVFELLTFGESKEYGPQLHDLFILHQEVRNLKPRHILEFGVGFSTIVMAHALKLNHDDETKKTKGATRQAAGRVFAVDSMKLWLDNCRNKFPLDLKPYADLRLSIPEVTSVAGELCHTFLELPDICPGLIYLDGPDPHSVQGEHHNLSFSMKDADNKERYAMSADILLYESSLKPGTRIIVDGRKNNTRFLRRTLKRRWKFWPNDTMNRYIFELVE